jgi:hypothetical protein
LAVGILTFSPLAPPAKTMSWSRNRKFKTLPRPAIDGRPSLL